MSDVFGPSTEIVATATTHVWNGAGMEHIKCNKDMAIVRANRVRAQTRMPHDAYKSGFFIRCWLLVFLFVLFGVTICGIVRMCALVQATVGQILRRRIEDAYE